MVLVVGSAHLAHMVSTIGHQRRHQIRQRSPLNANAKYEQERYLGMGPEAPVLFRKLFSTRRDHLLVLRTTIHNPDFLRRTPIRHTVPVLLRCPNAHAVTPKPYDHQMKEQPRLIRYDTSKREQQELLRKVLVDTWGGRCHWCGAVFPSATYADMDHIIPKSKFEEVKALLRAQYEAIYTPGFLATLGPLPEDADDIHNIAPACRAARNCNGRKSDTIDPEYMGVIVEGLKKAKANKQKISRKVNTLLEERGLTGHLVGCLALPDTDEVRHATRELGPQVLMSLWQVDKDIFRIFLPPDEVLLKMDPGELPDYFDTAFPSGTGLDGDLKLSNGERLTLMGAKVASGVDALQVTAGAIAEAVSSIDNEMINQLGDVPHPGLVGPRMLSVIDHQITQNEKPELEVRFNMKVAFGGQAVLEDHTDNDGAPLYEPREIEQEHMITCRIGLMDGEVAVDHASLYN